jgi:hypothetical protein
MNMGGWVFVISDQIYENLGSVQEISQIEAGSRLVMFNGDIPIMSTLVRVIKRALSRDPAMIQWLLRKAPLGN